MFVADEETKVITLHAGDTGAVTFTLEGYDFSNVEAKAIFTLKMGGKDIIKEEYYDIDEDNQFCVEFANADTDFLSYKKSYEYDVRVVIEPVYDANGKIYDGIVVRTPEDPIQFIIKRTVGEI